MASRVPVCPACLGRVRPLELVAFCDRCQRPLSSAIGATEPTLCGACRMEETDFDRLRSFGAYDAELRALIVLLKYSAVRPLARPLGSWLVRAAQQCPALLEVDAVVPVPLYPARQGSRGFNQAELLARELCRWVRLPVEARWLRRVKDTPSQAGLTPVQRLDNVRGAFAAARKLDTARILLLDDVCTTGATLGACARALRQAGAEQVNALTVARVVREI
ncbi:MAG: ComF family protein [Candidatus Acidiferrales bacterium]